MADCHKACRRYTKCRITWEMDYAKAWRAANPEKVAATKHRANLKKMYGITPEDYLELLAQQGGACAICRSTKPGGPARVTRFHVDHDHKTGRVRGLLCNSCNVGLGKFGDSPEFLRAALDYLVVVSLTKPHA